MDNTFCFTLSQKEYISFLSDQIICSKQMQGLQLFLYTSVPAILITLVFLFDIKRWSVVCTILALCILWVLYGEKSVFRSYVERKVETKLIPKLAIQEYNEVTYYFNEREIICEGKKKESIPYEKISSLIPLSKMFVIYYDSGTILLPYRVFASQKQMKHFLLSLECYRQMRYKITKQDSKDA